MKTSLVLSTYNGTEYVRPLLDSVAGQSLRFDEVLVRDDCSTDETFSLLSDYLSENSCPSWTLSRNEENRGWRKNFHDLICSARGDLIFPCDQDDVWDSEKNAVMSEVMSQNGDIDVLACLVNPIYEEGSIRTSAEKAEPESDSPFPVRRQDLSCPKALYVTRPGCTFCVRSSFVREVEPYWDEALPHDAVLWVLAEAKGSLALLDRQLVDFRRHSGNASDRRAVTLASRFSDIELHESLLDMAESFALGRGYMSDRLAGEMAELRGWLGSRRLLLGQRSFRQVPYLLSNNHYASFRAFAVDVCLSIFRNVSIDK